VASRAVPGGAISAAPDADLPDAVENPQPPQAEQAEQAVPDELPPVAVGDAQAAGNDGTDDGDELPVTSGRRVRARLARLAVQRGNPTGSPVLDPLLRTMRANHPKTDARLVQRAYDIAEYHHRNQFRKSGDPYITHPLAVATILAELGMSQATIVAALLHDTVEDTEYTLDVLKGDFGDEVAALVDGVTKLDKVKYGDAATAETVRKMVVAMARDPRVLVLKLADRLHNMRTLRYLPVEKQERKARETLEIYAPLAHRLGMNTLKWELEDLSFSTMFPKRYEEVVRLVTERAPSRETYLSSVIDQVNAELRTAKVKAVITGRPKHYYSIYQKMIVRGRDLNDIYDLLGVRVLVDSVRDCYAALGVIHSTWNPVPGRFKDFIAMPKFNLYQSLHTTVIGPDGKPVELQIRTHAMHRRAEYGIAAHWKYKEESLGGPESPGTGNDMAWLRQLLDWQKEAADPGEFLESLRFDIQGAEVYVFTPKGDVMALPQGSTPVDFAYAVHTEVGHRCIGARVNGRLVPLDSTLDNGDAVEIFTSKASGAGPSRDWLAYVKSPRARTKIRQWFAKERREDAIEDGKQAIARAMRKQGLPLQRLLSDDALGSLARELHYTDISGLYAGVGEGHVTAQTVIQRLIQARGGAEGAVEDLAETIAPQPKTRQLRPAGDPGVVVKGASDVWVKLARCCTPVPGDTIEGFVTRGNGVSVHRRDCVNLAALTASEPDRLVEVEWAPSASSVFLVIVQVEALDRSRLLADLTQVMSDQHVNILAASVTTTRDRVAVNRFTFEMGDPKHLGHVLKAVRAVDGVYDAYRVTAG
jgi:guanosine-3',5'-bis(diphosphate) 3'-pyrophosphohydrolase